MRGVRRLGVGVGVLVASLPVLGQGLTARAAGLGLPAGERVPMVAPAGAKPKMHPTGQEHDRKFSCQAPSADFHCYTPTQLRSAYGFDPLLARGQDGSGRTIVIIDAFQDPTISSDLASFDDATGLPAPPSFSVVAPFGITPFDPSNPEQVGWSSEIALDVEWAHAIAPGARIVLALAPSNSGANLVATERYVIQHDLGDVVSMSYVETEGCVLPSALQEEEHALFATAVRQGMTLVAGAGDVGATELNCEETGLLANPAVGVPASDPNVTGVGGTTLRIGSDTGLYESEVVWDEPEPEELFGAGGGGFSSLYGAPRYQKGVPGITTRRGVPDVAYNASLTRGVLVAWGSQGQPHEFWVFGGTSCGTPQWAALAAIADQVGKRRLGNINPALYAIGQSPAYASAFHDITVGDNGFPPVAGYAAMTGWDPASGLGSPIAENLVPLLATGP